MYYTVLVTSYYEYCNYLYQENFEEKDSFTQYYHNTLKTLLVL